MLVELKVNHFAIIDSIHLQFQKGLNILSGETGAGKSVLLKSLALLMGEKASADMIRTGENMAVVEGCFDLSDRPDVVDQLKALDISCDDPELIVRRIVAAHDRSKVYMNGSLCTLNMLRDVVAPLIEVAGHNAPLIEMTGQHDNKNLMARSYHLEFLDLYANCGELRDRYEKLWREWGAQKFQLEKLIQESQTHSQRIDYLEFQRNEITALELAPGEEFEIENNLKRLKNSSRIIQIIESIESALDTDTESALQRLRSAKRRYHELEQLDQTLQTQQGMHENIEQAESLLSDFLFSLRKYADRIEVDPQQQETLESRLSSLRKLQKKYGQTTQDILCALVQIETELSSIANSSTEIDRLKKLTVKTELELKRMAESLHESRRNHSSKLAKAVNNELADLNMKGVIFSIEIAKGVELGSMGLDSVEFMIQSGSKDQVRSLAKFASGGELSRVLLSLKKVIGKSTMPRTYLFDEVDAGVSGETAQKVGRKLHAIAEGQQVVCITHLPQVAAFGDVHFYISKSTQKGNARMDVRELTNQDRIEEIARLISGEKITRTSLDHAKNLLELRT